MEVGHFNQRAPNLLTVFVFSCIIVTIGLLYIKVKAEEKADNITEESEYYLEYL